MEDGDMVMEWSWREFVMARMMRMDAMPREVKEMQRENMENRQEYFREVGKVQKDVRVRQIVEWVEEKKSDEEPEEELEDRLEDGEKEEEVEMELKEMIEEAEDGAETGNKMELEVEMEKETEEKTGDRDVEMEE